MCILCEGPGRDELLFQLHGAVTDFGWVAASQGWADFGVGWLHTVGLTAVGHPELVLLDIPPDIGEAILEPLAEGVLDGDVLVPGDHVDLGGLDAELVSVHPAHVTSGLMLGATAYYEALGRPGAVEGLQVLVPTTPFYCATHTLDPPRLNEQWAWDEQRFLAERGVALPTNRAQRRAANRRRGHHGRQWN